MKALIRLATIALLLVTWGSTLPGQTVATANVMREKLAHSEKILESIMTSNLDMLGRESQALSRATTAPGWAVLKSPEYLQRSADFQREAESLVDAAKAKDLDSAAKRYASMTLSCYQCHRYIRGMRIAK
jgi:Cytochrome C'